MEFNPEYVSGDQLGIILRQWIEQYLLERPLRIPMGESQTGDRKIKAEYFVGPISYIVQETGLDPRQIRDLKDGTKEIVTFQMADRILTPLHLGYKFNNGELPVSKNPKWSSEKWFSYMKGRGCIYE